jgi:DNA invertase Pin-like site-specific DNA recombinase
VSTPEQRHGTGLERQTSGDVDGFAERFGFAVSNHDLVDDGVSAWKGLNATPKHALGKFLSDVRRGKIPAGDCLLIEDWTRLSRQDPWAAIGLVSELKQNGIHIGRLDTMRLLRADSTELGDAVDALVKLAQGNEESNRKSKWNGAAWKSKRKDAADKGAIMTAACPAWLEIEGRRKVGKHMVGGTYREIPERVAAVRRTFELAAAGHGRTTIVAKLNAEGVKPFGRPLTEADVESWDRRRKEKRKPLPTAKEKDALRRRIGELGFWKADQQGLAQWVPAHWNGSAIGNIIKDRRVLGEFQAKRQKGRENIGKPIEGFFPAIIDEDLFLTVQGKLAERRARSGSSARFRGRTSSDNIFAGLLNDARGTGSYYVRWVQPSQGYGTRHQLLINTSAVEGRANYFTFPYATFERAILSGLHEIDPREIINGHDATDEALDLGTQAAGLDSQIEKLEAALETAPDLSPVVRALSKLVDKRRDLGAKLDLAQQKAAHPLSETWGEAQTLIEALEKAPDPEEARLRLRSPLRRIVDSISILVVSRGADLICRAQINFSGTDEFRSFTIFHRAPRSNGKQRKEGQWRWFATPRLKPKTPEDVSALEDLYWAWVGRERPKSKKESGSVSVAEALKKAAKKPVDYDAATPGLSLVRDMDLRDPQEVEFAEQDLRACALDQIFADGEPLPRSVCP